MKAKKTSDKRLLNTTAATKTAAITHQARTRAASSAKSACGRARLSAVTTTEAMTSTPNTSRPICMTGERLLMVVARFIRSPSARVRLRHFSQRSSQTIPAGQQREQRRDGEHPGPHRQRTLSDECY